MLKNLREMLGAGTAAYFSKDSARKTTEPGGVAIIVGPTLGTSFDHAKVRTDKSGHGILVRVRLRTISGFLSVYGTYWPFVSSRSQSEDLSAKLWNRVREYCRGIRLHNPDPIVYIQSLLDQWTSHDWEEGCEGKIIGGDFNST
jgi:hypothetical protein